MLSRLIIAIFFSSLVMNAANAYLFLLGTPDWFMPPTYYGGYNYIPDALTTSHVTGIELGLSTDGAIYTVNILGDGITRTVYPYAGCNALNGSIYTLTVGPNERITTIEAWRNGINSKWCRIRITLNDGVTK
jgi:hypothetical protein